MPQMILFAGPNGSGKTTIAHEFYSDLLDKLEAERINADDIAQALLELHGGRIEDHSLPAAQISDDRVRKAISERRNFAVESVLSSSKFKDMLNSAQAAGFDILTVFVYIRSPDVNVKRVEQRVKEGGHAVPEDKVRDRHPKSLANLEWCSDLSDMTIVYENDRRGYAVIAASRDNSGWAAHDLTAFNDFVSIVSDLWSPAAVSKLH